MNDDLYSIADIELKLGSGTKKLDYGSYARLQESIEENLEKVGKEESLERRKENTRFWLESVPKRWRSVSIKDFEIFPIIKEKLIKNRFHSFFVNSSVSEGLGIGYGLLRVFVSRGWVSPSKIAVISEEDLLAAATGGFEGTAFLNNFLKNRVFMVTLGDKSFLNERELAAWSRLISQCFEEGQVLILIGDAGFDNFSEVLNKSASEMLRALIGENIVGSGSSYNDVVDDYSVFK